MRMRNLGLKIVSVFIAVLLWLIVAGQRQAERGLRVPVEVQNLPAGIEVVDLPVETVDVRVRGPSSTLARLGPGDVIVVLDLQSVKPGQRLFHLTADQIRAPFDVEATQIDPPTVALTFEAAASRSVPVAPAVVGDVAPGHVIASVTADPPAFEVVGPQSLIRRVGEVLTEPVSVEGATSTVRESVTVGAASVNVRLKAPQRAQVEVTVIPAPAERTLVGIPVQFRNLAAGLVARALPARVAVRVRGTREALDRLGSASVTPFVDLASLGPGAYELPVRVDPARSVGAIPTFGVTAIDPPVVHVAVD